MKEHAEETFMQTVYTLGDVMYIPNYRNPHVFVGPGYPIFSKNRYSAEQLVSAGAQPSAFPLWRRANLGVITDKNP